ncbi:MAG: CvpA family protein [Elusimicrobiota bacterium]
MERLGDLVAAGVVLYCVVRGFQRGFYGALLSFAGLVGGYVAVYFFSRPCGTYLAEHEVLPQMFAGMAASMLIFMAVSLTASLLSTLLSGLLVPKDGSSLIARFYRLGGAAVGLVSGGFFAAIYVLLILFLRAGNAAVRSQDFTPATSERVVARAATAAMELFVDNPAKSKNLAVVGVFMVVSDPEKGMVELKEKAKEKAEEHAKKAQSQLPKDLDPRVKEMLENPEIRKLQQQFN